MRKINRFFFEAEQISLSDKLWFYGGIALMITIGVFGLWQ